MKKIGQIFLRGTLIILPIFVSIYFLIWLAQALDGITGRMLSIFNPSLQLPYGFGFFLGAAIIFTVGVTSELFIAKSINNLLQRLMDRIPLVGAIFNSLKSFADYLDPKNNTARGKTVVVHFPSKEAAENKFKLIGFLTQSELSSMPKGVNDNDVVSVYFPMSYQVGGYTVFVKKSQVEEIDLSFEKAMQGTLTGWVQISKDTLKKDKADF